MALPSIASRIPEKSRRKYVRWGLISGNFVLLLAVAVFIVTNRSASQTIRSSTVSSAVGSAAAISNPLDELSSAKIALQAAQMTNIPEIDAVKDQADSESTLLAVVSHDDSVITKPQIVSTAQKSKHDIIRYTTVAGDTVTSIAAKFGLAANSIRWSNNLGGEIIPAGRELLIPPANGVVYKVKAGDSIDSLVNRYQANRDSFIAVNDAESGTLAVGSLIWIPNATQPVAPARLTASAIGFSGSAIFGSNGYTRGYCTYWAAFRRNQVGSPIPTNLGHAITWASRARSMGMRVDSTPAAGAVLYHRNIGGLGHVAFVERVNDDGSLHVSDMNFPSWNRVTYRTVPVSELGSYYFIH